MGKGFKLLVFALLVGASFVEVGADTTPPLSQILGLSKLEGIWYPVKFWRDGNYYVPNTTINITGNASDNAGVARVWVSFDGGATWKLANGTTSWSYDGWIPSAAGTYTIKSKAEDTDGNNQTTPHSITVVADFTNPSASASLISPLNRIVSIHVPLRVSVSVSDQNLYSACAYIYGYSYGYSGGQSIVYCYNASFSGTIEWAKENFNLTNGTVNVTVERVAFDLYENKWKVWGLLNRSHLRYFYFDSAGNVVKMKSHDEFGELVEMPLSSVNAGDQFTVRDIHYGEQHNLTLSSSASNLKLLKTHAPSGTYYFYVGAEDKAQNDNYSSSFEFRVDNDPAVQVFVHPTPPNGTTTADTRVIINITSNENLSLAVLEWNNSNYSMTNSSPTNWYREMTNLTDGNYTYRVWCKDLALNPNVTETRVLRVDTTFLAVNIQSPRAGGYYNTSNISLNVSANRDVDTWWYSLDGGANTTFEIIGARTASALLTNLLEGLHNVTVYANDSTGRLASAAQYFTVDLTPPVVYFVDPTPANGSVLIDTRDVTVNISADEPLSAAVLYWNNGTHADAIPMNCSGRQCFQALRNVPYGEYSAYAEAFDLAGNSNTTETRHAQVGAPDIAMGPLGINGDFRWGYYMAAVGKPVNVTIIVLNLGLLPLKANSSNVSITVNKSWPRVVIYNETRLIPVPIHVGGNYTFNVTYTPSTSDWQLVQARADPDYAVNETREDNNVRDRWLYAGSSDLVARIIAPPAAEPGSNVTVFVEVQNLGGVTSEATTLNISHNPSRTVPIPPLAPWQRNTTSFTLENIAATVAINASVLPVPSESYTLNNNDSKVIAIAEYSLNITNVRGPWYTVFEDSGFYVYARYAANIPGVVNASIDMPPGLNISGWDTQNKSVFAQATPWNYVWWWLRAEEAGEYNFTVTLSARNKTALGHPDSRVVVVEPTVVVKDTNSSLFDGNTSNLPHNGSIRFQIFNVTTLEKEVCIHVSGGAEGRILMGLEWLVGYPHGCPEQTMSPTQAALRVWQYYRKFNQTKFEELNSTLYSKILAGVRRMTPPGGDNAQKIGGVNNGGWGWGNGAPTLFYTYYTAFTLGSIFNDPDFKNDPNFTALKANISFDNASLWLMGKQQKAGTNNGSWQDWGYISGRVPATGFILRTFGCSETTNTACVYNLLVNDTVKGLLNSSMRNATAYLLTKQIRSGGDAGGWNEHGAGANPDAFSTALAVFGLLATGEVQPNQPSILNATQWLLDNQLSDGSWSNYPGHSSSSYSYSGANSETTAYVLLALNASGLNSSHPKVSRGIGYLVDAYVSGGRWGATKATKAVIKALTDLQVSQLLDKNVELALRNASGSVVYTKSITMSTANVKERICLNESTLMLVGPGNNSLEVSTTGTIGTVLVAVDTKQVAPKKKALKVVPREYIDPIAEDFSLAIEPVESEIIEGGNVTFKATITNGDANNSLYVMILTVNIPENVSFDDSTSPWYVSNGTNISVEYMLNETERKLYLYPGSDDEEAVAKGSSEDYHFKMRLTGSGTRTLEASVVPMYNDMYFASASTTFYVKGYGSVGLKALLEDGSDANADFDLGGEVKSGAKASYNIIEGVYALRINQTGYRDVITSLNVTAGTSRNYTATLYGSLPEPDVLFSEGRARPIFLQYGGTETRTYNLTVSSEGGLVTIAMDTPQNYNFSSVSIDDRSVDYTVYNNTVYATEYIKGDAKVSFAFTLLESVSLVTRVSEGEVIGQNSSLSEVEAQSRETVFDGTLTMDAASNASALNASGITETASFKSLDTYLRADTNFLIDWAVIKLFYYKEDVENESIDEDTIRLYWWNGSDWRVLETGRNYTSEGGPYVYEATQSKIGVERYDRGYVRANLSHLSVFGIGGNIITVPAAAGVGAGGGGGAALPAALVEGTQSLGLSLMSSVISELGIRGKAFYRMPNTLAAVYALVGDVTGEWPAPRIDISTIVTKPITTLEGDVYELAVQRVKKRWVSAPAVVIARGDLEVDSMAAVAYAKARGIPMLLTKPGELPSTVQTAMKGLSTSNVIIAGGPVAVSKDVESKLSSIAPVERIAGVNREETAVELAKALEKVKVIDTIVVADGLNVAPEAVIIAASYRAPIVYAAGDSLSQVTRDFLADHKVTKGAYRKKMKVVLVGISDKAQREIETLMK